MRLVRDAMLTLVLVACSSSTESTSASALSTQNTMGAPIEVPGNGAVVGGDEPSAPAESTTPSGGAGGASSGEASPAPAPAEPAPTPAPEPTTPTPTPAPVAMPYRGVNLAGAEFGSAIPGNDGTDYSFPTPAEVDYFRSKGMNTFRIGFKWERMQSAAYGALDATYAGKLDAIVDYATKAGATIIVQPHNFARYYGTTVGSTSVPNGVFADLWKKLAARYAANAKVMFNLVNEPHDIPTEQWVGAANAAIAAIRTAGASNTIVVPGNGWTGAHAWLKNDYGTSNAVAMLDIADPGNNLLFEVHQYLDATSGGVSSTCVSSTIGSERLAGFVQWLRDNGKKGFVGELAGADNATCDAALKDMLDYMMKSSDVLVGWTYWAAGPRWSANYMFDIEPVNGADKPRMTKLAPYLF